MKDEENGVSMKAGATFSLCLSRVVANTVESFKGDASCGFHIKVKWGEDSNPGYLREVSCNTRFT